MIEQKTFNNKKKLNKTVRLVALEIWILVFYKNKKFDDIIKKSFDFNKLDKRDKSFLFLLINTCMRRHNQAQKIYNKSDIVFPTLRKAIKAIIDYNSNVGDWSNIITEFVAFNDGKEIDRIEKN